MPYVVEPMQLEDIPEVTDIERHSFSTQWPVYAYQREINDNRNSRYIVVRWLAGDNGHLGPAESVSLAHPPEEPTSVASVDIERPTLEPAHAARGPDHSATGLRGFVGRMWPFSRQSPPSHRPPPPRGTVVAYAGLWLIHDEAHITTIAVRPDLRGQALGELMLSRMLEQAQEMGADRVTLEVRMSNAVAQNLYRKYTFVVEGVRRRYYSDDNEDAMIMTTAPLSSPEFTTKFAENRAALDRRLSGKVARRDD